MKNITPRLIELLKQGYCTPKILALANKLREPSTTLHYNIKKLEREGAIKSYKAVFDYKKIGEGFCSYVLINLSPDEYGDPEKVAKELSKHNEVESIDICTGDYELIIKIRAKDQDAFYELVKQILSKKGITKTKSIISLKQVKTEFVCM